MATVGQQAKNIRGHLVGSVVEADEEGFTVEFMEDGKKVKFKNDQSNNYPVPKSEDRIALMEVVNMGRDRYGNPLSPGDAVSVESDGYSVEGEYQGEVSLTSLKVRLNGNIEAVPLSQVCKVGGRRAKMYEVSPLVSHAKCPYCAKSVAYITHSRKLGDHRVPGGYCAGSGSDVDSIAFDGKAVLAQKAEK